MKFRAGWVCSNTNLNTRTQISFQLFFLIYHIPVLMVIRAQQQISLFYTILLRSQTESFLLLTLYLISAFHSIVFFLCNHSKIRMIRIDRVEKDIAIMHNIPIQRWKSMPRRVIFKFSSLWTFSSRISWINLLVIIMVETPSLSNKTKKCVYVCGNEYAKWARWSRNCAFS